MKLKRLFLENFNSNNFFAFFIVDGCGAARLLLALLYTGISFHFTLRNAIN